MIAVIADDLTGAVEIAGIGLRYGLRVDIVSTLDQSCDADLLVIATDTRSMPEQKAVETMAAITAKIKTFNPQFLFKKVDSVLRGHVLAELNVHLKELGLAKALLIPANPALGRTLTNGQYFVNGQPIHQTSFANDPDFAITGADVPTLLRCDKNAITIQTVNGTLSQTGITVGECVTENDLKQWANKVDNQTLLAGGSSFFAAILGASGYTEQAKQHIYPFEKPALFISGTTYDKSRQLISQLKADGGPVSYMPKDIIALANPTENLYDQWADEVVALLNRHNKAIVAIDENTANAAGNLRQKQALLVEKVLKKITVKELLIEGGATASAIIKQLNLDSFTPVQEFSTGVIRMRSAQKDGLFLTMKPGSYNWPAQVWDLY